ncbi:hypothetical protein FK004_13820 [Flavobacterium kingsejongi]|uniref:Vitamin K epoxide reductase domain-containing protein n=1 Tax=Flavobacterium kingsejongi TaxID=1678728 RepID=A0A2S1LR75_9FLAO|nr:hypothetical protein FK004_13820 [Flavobacterium kingsejongi]
MQSHPDSSSLLSISDTLNFFNISNSFFEVQFSDLNLLPNKFICLLIDEQDKKNLYLIEKKGDYYFSIYNSKRNKIELSTLKSSWCNIVLHIEIDQKQIIKPRKNNPSLLLLIVLLLLFLSLCITSRISEQISFFICLVFIGILLSILSLKSLIGFDFKLLDSICNLNSCSTLLSSKKWKIQKFIDFSDLSIVFFISQFSGIIVFLFANKINEFMQIQKIVLFSSIPIILLSLYFQKFIEKKWCILCLFIVAIIGVELIYLSITTEITHIYINPWE